MVVSAVIFDFYGTLAHFADAGAPDYETLYQAIFAVHGYALEKAALDDYYRATTGSSTASIRSARRPTRPGFGPASMTSPSPAVCEISTSRT